MNKDMKWWQDRMPVGYRLYGFIGRDYASFVSPSGELFEIDGKLVQSMPKDTHPYDILYNSKRKTALTFALQKIA